MRFGRTGRVCHPGIRHGVLLPRPLVGRILGLRRRRFALLSRRRPLDPVARPLDDPDARTVFVASVHGPGPTARTEGPDVGARHQPWEDVPRGQGRRRGSSRGVEEPRRPGGRGGTSRRGRELQFVGSDRLEREQGGRVGGLRRAARPRHRQSGRRPSCRVRLSPSSFCFC